MEISNKEIFPGIWRFTETINKDEGITVYYYLVAGSERALLIDTGLAQKDFSELLQGVTSLPCILVNTHTHPDHTGGNKNFEEIYAHPAAQAAEEKLGLKLNPVTEGYVFDLGGRTVEVIEVPGHTKDSICLLVPDLRILFVGDTLHEQRPLFMLDEFCDLDEYIRTMDKVIGISNRFDTILPGHGTEMVSVQAAIDLKDLVEMSRKEETPYKIIEVKAFEPGAPNEQMRQYTYKNVAINRDL